MEAVLEELLRGVEVTEPIETGGLQVFGLRWRAPVALDYATLDEALSAGQVEVTERKSGARVGELHVTNCGRLPVLIVAGELLEGAMQNRVLNLSMLVPEESERLVPVSCVEQGRWAGHSPRFRSAHSSSSSTLRLKMAKGLSRSYNAHQRPCADQHEVWQEVAATLSSLGSSSMSGSFLQCYDDSREVLAESVTALRLPADCHGVAFSRKGRIVGVDLFDQPATLSKLLGKLTKGYLIDALRQPGASGCVCTDDVRAWLAKVAQMPSQRYTAQGLGEDVRIDGPEAVGGALVVDGKPVHLEVFSVN